MAHWAGRLIKVHSQAAAGSQHGRFTALYSVGIHDSHNSHDKPGGSNEI